MLIGDTCDVNCKNVDREKFITCNQFQFVMITLLMCLLIVLVFVSLMVLSLSLIFWMNSSGYPFLWYAKKLSKWGVVLFIIIAGIVIYVQVFEKGLN